MPIASRPIFSAGYLPQGITILHLVVRQQNMAMMEVLYDFGADVNVVSKQESASMLYDAVAAKVCPVQCSGSGGL